MLRTDHLSKEFPGVKALDDVSMEFREGEVHCLIGENGAGKSTLIKAIAGYHAPTSGTITVHGKRIFGDEPFRWQRNAASKLFIRSSTTFRP